MKSCGLALALLLALCGCDRPSSPVDAAGQPVDPFAPGARAVVLIFVTPDCPIANRYAPELARLHARFTPQGARFWLVYADKDISTGAIGKHRAEFGLPCAALRDPRHHLVKRARATVTPEAAVFTDDGALVYHGRIDDRVTDFGKARPEPARRDLEEVLSAIIANRPVTNTHQPAIGCYIPGVSKTR